MALPGHFPIWVFGVLVCESGIESGMSSPAPGLAVRTSAAFLPCPGALEEVVAVSAGLPFVLFCIQASHHGKGNLRYFLIVRSMDLLFFS